MTARDRHLSGLISRLFGRGRPDPHEVTAAVTGALSRVPGVGTTRVAYNHLQYGAGALSGLVDLEAAEDFDDALRATYAALVDVLGEHADRVVVYLSGRGPDGAAVTAESLGLPAQPTGRDLARRYASAPPDRPS